MPKKLSTEGKARKSRKVDTSKFEYIKIGTSYYRNIEVPNAGGKIKRKLVPWTRQDLLDFQGKDFLKKIKQFTSMCNVPNHLNYQQEIGNAYNLYYDVDHTPAHGEWPWIENLLRHIFGDQYDLGIDYMQLLYLDPLHKLPILCLVSKENATGKTTFLNFLHMIFKSNVATLGNQDLSAAFNAHYATKLVIAVDESKIDKTNTLEKIKSMATAKTIFYSAKFKNPEEIDFFGKIILLSNYEENFVNAKDDDIRYWIRKIPMPKEINYDIEKNLLDELPAFLDYLLKRKMSTQKKSRMWFSAEDIETEALQNVKAYSRSWLTKEIEEHVENWFIENPHKEVIHMRAIEVKEKWYHNNHKVEIAYIRRLLRDEVKCNHIDKPIRYAPIDVVEITTVGRPYEFNRSDYLDNEVITELLNKNIEDQPF